jgi:hypothetical protein
MACPDARSCAALCIAKTNWIHRNNKFAQCVQVLHLLVARPSTVATSYEERIMSNPASGRADLPPADRKRRVLNPIAVMVVVMVLGFLAAMEITAPVANEAPPLGFPANP